MRICAYPFKIYKIDEVQKINVYKDIHRMCRKLRKPPKSTAVRTHE
jgi:hypothetical protein